MGRLTGDMMRLAGEVRAGHADRARLMRELRQGTVEMRRAVAMMQAGFRSARADLAQRQRRMLHGFVSGLRGTVGRMRKECADDLAGARRAWVGAAAAAIPGPGRGRRGAKWYGGEVA